MLKFELGNRSTANLCGNGGLPSGFPSDSGEGCRAARSYCDSDEVCWFLKSRVSAHRLHQLFLAGETLVISFTIFYIIHLHIQHRASLLTQYVYSM